MDENLDQLLVIYLVFYVLRGEARGLTRVFIDDYLWVGMAVPKMDQKMSQMKTGLNDQVLHFWLARQ